MGYRRSGELLGKGGFGTVRVVTHKETKQKFALKVRELLVYSTRFGTGESFSREYSGLNQRCFRWKCAWCKAPSELLIV